MTMNVKGPTQNNPALIAEQQRTQLQGRQEQQAKQAHQPAQPGANVDTVSLTDTATHLKSLEKQLASQPVVDKERVEAMKQKIASGSFRVDPARVAEKMLNLEGMISHTLKE